MTMNLNGSLPDAEARASMLDDHVPCAECGFFRVAHFEVSKAIRCSTNPHPATLGHLYVAATRPEPDPNGRCRIWMHECVTHGVPDDAGHAFFNGRINTLD